MGFDITLQTDPDRIIAQLVVLNDVTSGDEGKRRLRAYKPNQSIGGRAIISQKMVSTAPKAGKPNANQSRNRLL